ncbi:MAG: glycosyltransferase [Bacteroidetes bacterium]|nr:MAG: glycosyltransferase [Bacteroidota bacterium]
MLREKFGDKIILIDNQQNTGFSKANNQGIAIARGRYILLLNPDTVVAEDTFRRCLDFMDDHPDGGALGVHMIDGQGIYLPESKRALPTPAVSFYKIFGFSALFPRSPVFGKYHLTYLDKYGRHEIEILSGAFMWLRKELTDRIGGLDEAFFMYGEDIDLSYRVIQAGYKNYYLGDTPILHYKGESTKKGSLNYVKVFYQAMIIFARKHFGGRNRAAFIAAIRLAVYFRALLAAGRRIAEWLWLPLLESGLIYTLMYGIKAYWEHYVKYIESGAYPPEFAGIYMPVYTLIFVLLLWLNGAYHRPFRLRPLVMGPFWGFVTIATGTFMFSSVVKNFSRAIVGLSAVFTLLSALAIRGLIHWREKGSFFFTEEKIRRSVLLGTAADVQRVAELIRTRLHYPSELVGAVTPDAPVPGLTQLGKPEQLRELAGLLDIQEIVCCQPGISYGASLQLLETYRDLPVSIRFAPPESDYIIGAHTVYSSEAPRPALSLPENRRKKRRFEQISSALLLLGTPLWVLFVRKPGAALSGLWDVQKGDRQLIGYAAAPADTSLPPLKPGLLSLRHRNLRAAEALAPEALDQHYAGHWSLHLDLAILLNGFRWLGT